MTGLLGELRHALRTLRRSPGFAAVAVLTLALGVGANTAVFSVVRGILLRPLPYRDVDRLMIANLSVPDFRDLRDANRSFDRMAVFASNKYTLAAGGETEQLLGGVVSSDFFPLLSAARLGRVFLPGEMREPVVVLSDRLWRSRFAGDRTVLGRTIVLSGKPYAVIGVMPPEFAEIRMTTRD